MSQDINKALADLDGAIAKAIDAARAAGLYRGLVVAELQDHAQTEAAIMVN
ncbi:hypothetical protein [Pseudomonas sp. 2(2015)]|uniref:hypothetical protein n=1 Tax=Pseudomonas sp. 2(2015) TaxID=1619950 RepID=UPI000A442912|nr:hypothetical protein [Pseudomonas sp. 2(2015)]